MTSFRLGWATDTHFDQFSLEEQESFIEQCLSASIDSLLITGDISTSDRLLKDLNFVQSTLSVPLFFICGNHDFYGSSIDKVRTHLKSIKPCQTLFYLTQESYVQLGKETALIGHDAWSDGRCGDYLASPLDVQDKQYIEDYQGLSKEGSFKLVKELADQATKHFETHLPRLVKKFEKIVIAIHPPPFREACLYHGEIADDVWGPHFVAKGVGDYLLDLAKEHPKNKFLILCGHAHCGSNSKQLDNLSTITGAVRGEKPKLQKVISL